MIASRSISKALVAAMLVFSSFGAATAQAPASTLDRIAQTGLLRIGYSADSAPFSYLGPDGKPIGYSIELCLKVAEHLQRQMGLSNIDIAYVRRTTSDRVALLKSGDIDIECVASTNNAERRKSVAFSYPHFITSVQFIALKDGGLKLIADLKGRVVTSTSGTTVISKLNAASRERDLNVVVIATPDHEMGFEMMASGRVSAFVMDGILLSTIAANSDDPSRYILSDDALGQPEPYGLMLRHDDEAFRQAVDAALHDIFTQGEIVPLYAKWFTQPIPPHGVNLNLPMSRELVSAFAAPVAVMD